MSTPMTLALVALTCTAGCGGIAGNRSLAPRPRTLGVITAAEMRDAGVRDAYQALVWLRPEIVAQTISTAGAPLGTTTVYLDGRPIGELEVLSRIPTTWIATIRFIKASTAEPQFRADAQRGAIAITTIPAGQRQR